MKRIDEWLVDSQGSIRGIVVDSDRKYVTPIHTSRVVHRDGNVVTTRSGSHYELLEPCKVHMDRYVLDAYFDGAKDPLAAIDYSIKQRPQNEG